MADGGASIVTVKMPILSIAQREADLLGTLPPMTWGGGGGGEGGGGG